MPHGSPRQNSRSPLTSSENGSEIQSIICLSLFFPFLGSEALLQQVQQWIGTEPRTGSPAVISEPLPANSAWVIQRKIAANMKKMFSGRYDLLAGAC
jgi:hypothetical protein